MAQTMAILSSGPLQFFNGSRLISRAHKRVTSDHFGCLPSPTFIIRDLVARATQSNTVRSACGDCQYYNASRIMDGKTGSLRLEQSADYRAVDSSPGAMTSC
jgi:hypothetical protein